MTASVTTGLRTLVVGAGEAGRALTRDLLRTSRLGLLPVGFLDDNPAKRGIDEVDVVGRLDDIAAAVVQHCIEVVVIAIPELPAQRFLHVARAAEANGASVRYLPSFVAALRRDV